MEQGRRCAAGWDRFLLSEAQCYPLHRILGLRAGWLTWLWDVQHQEERKMGSFCGAVDESFLLCVLQGFKSYVEAEDADIVILTETKVWIERVLNLAYAAFVDQSR